MKPISIQYHETLIAARRCKPRSERKAVLTKKLKELLTRQIKWERRQEKRERAA